MTIIENNPPGSALADVYAFIRARVNQRREGDPAKNLPSRQGGVSEWDTLDSYDTMIADENTERAGDCTPARS